MRMTTAWTWQWEVQHLTGFVAEPFASHRNRHAPFDEWARKSYRNASQYQHWLDKLPLFRLTWLNLIHPTLALCPAPELRLYHLPWLPLRNDFTRLLVALSITRIIWWQCRQCTRYKYEPELWPTRRRDLFIVWKEFDTCTLMWNAYDLIFTQTFWKL